MKRSEPDLNLPTQPVQPGESPDDTVSLKGKETPPVSPTRSESPTRRRPDRTAIPAILLEGDEPKVAPDARAAHKFAGEDQPKPQTSNVIPQELPASYGTGRLLLTARDPRCLYAHWDLPASQKQSYVELSADKQLVLRVHHENLAGPVITELKLDPESGHSFVPVNVPGVNRYVADLGYYPPGAPWRSVASSEVTVAPAIISDKPEEPARFATMSFPLPAHSEVKVVAAEPPEIVSVPASGRSAAAPAPNLTAGFPFPAPYKGAGSASIPPGTDAEHNPASSSGESGEPSFLPSGDLFEHLTDFDALLPEFPVPAPNPPWTAAQERALAELIGWSLLKREWIDSAGITELIRGHQADEVSLSAPLSAGERAIAQLPSSAEVVNLPVPQQGFWFNVQAELVIYGATEPDASVTIGGRPIPLRQDGTFSYRFALPDGSFKLPLAAVSTRGDLRQAELDFHRGTVYSEGTGSLAHNPELKTPSPENIG